ncbi:indole-3-glycerol phosphate synthase TrpC [Ammoniphilus sp. CFH 90114]|uniref:indole-3-glycerol phosphate synthase TrpC n=1 Tax=Ammoniphilus sp. CFH 90114 TaxID=2493665 RepID=UPI00100F018F|nr:indole-3-glycerol phosphate synthase TrpC [Ammoniphilus sp. CFH 90114]RXT13914.1 indole-3-glycerol phosphate synthase TrpC [Ammoniphilus sp. CFH 90114]
MLHKIVEQKHREIELLKQQLDLKQAERLVMDLSPTRPFIDRLIHSHRPVSVIAEVKKASPSKGLIREDFDPLFIAQAYEEAQVDAMSVLTDVPFFQGSKEYLEQISQQCQVPIIRKDFLVDPLQVYEARLMGADCILLIAAILTSQQLAELSTLAKDLDLDVLIEVHNREELELVLTSTHPGIIGINNRNLKTFETSLSTTEELLKYVPTGLPVVSESGIHSSDDIRYLEGLGVRAVLVGEHFMRQQNIRLAVEELVGC